MTFACTRPSGSGLHSPAAVTFLFPGASNCEDKLRLKLGLATKVQRGVRAGRQIEDGRRIAADPFLAESGRNLLLANRCRRRKLAEQNVRLGSNADGRRSARNVWKADVSLRESDLAAGTRCSAFGQNGRSAKLRLWVVARHPSGLPALAALEWRARVTSGGE